MTWIEVTDTAIKIGLGAIITAIGGYVILSKTHAHEVKKEKWKRTQDILEGISKDFEIIHKHLIERASTNFSVKKGIKSMEQLMGKEPSDIDGFTFNALGQTKQDFLNLYTLEGRLLLLGGTEPQKLMEEYRITATKIEDTPITSPDAVNQLKPIVDELYQKRSNFYHSISELYTKP